MKDKQSDSQLHLYQRMKQSVKENIENGVYRQGDKLPNETELEAIYSVSRITVRRAIKELCDEGLLVKKQGKGTFVVGFNQLSYDGIGFKEAMAGIGKKPQMTDLGKSYGNIPLHLAKVLGISASKKNIIQKRLMIADGEPVSVDVYYILSEVYEGLYEKLNAQSDIMELLTGEYNMSETYNRKMLGVVRASKEVAELLKCSEGDPVYEFFRVAYNEDNLPVLLTTSHIVCENTYYTLDDSRRDASKTGLVWG